MVHDSHRHFGTEYYHHRHHDVCVVVFFAGIVWVLDYNVHIVTKGKSFFKTLFQVGMDL